MTSSTLTNAAVLDRFNITASDIEHLDEQVPILTSAQAQGDVTIIPVAPRALTEAIPGAGVTVVTGERAGGNAHILHTLEGQCYWEASSSADTNLVQGWLTVPEDSVATLIHTQEHGVLAVGPGCYEIRRAREFAGEWRRIAD